MLVCGSAIFLLVMALLVTALRRPADQSRLDAIPGHVNVLRIEAATPGTYAGQSAEFSGRGYREHVFEVVAHDAAGWAAFLQDGTPSPVHRTPPPATAWHRIAASPGAGADLGSDPQWPAELRA